MVKWMIKALELGTSNLHEFLRYRLSLYQPYQGGRWKPSLEFFTLKGHSSRQRSLGWNRAAQVWKSILPDLHYVPPKCLDDLMSYDLWSCLEAPLIGPGFSRLCAANLHKAGLRKYRDAIRGRGFISTVEAQARFGLKPVEQVAWEAATHLMSRKWHRILSTPQGRVGGGEWVGIYRHQNSITPELVLQITENFTPKTGTSNWWVPLSVLAFSMNPRSATLLPVHEDSRLAGTRWDARGEDLEIPVRGTMRRVKVVDILRGPKQICTHLFYGRSDKLEWDPDRFEWYLSTPLMNTPRNWEGEFSRTVM
jgi:hypothetical protein